MNLTRLFFECAMCKDYKQVIGNKNGSCLSPKLEERMHYVSTDQSINVSHFVLFFFFFLHLVSASRTADSELKLLPKVICAICKNLTNNADMLVNELLVHRKYKRE